MIRPEINEATTWASFPPTGIAFGDPEDRLRRESSESRVCGDMSLFRAAARKGLDSRLRGNDARYC